MLVYYLIGLFVAHLDARQAMECMKSWPLIQRNKVEDSKVFVPVDTLKTSENETVSALATSLIAQWDNLECAYRIPKRGKGDADDEADLAELEWGHTVATASLRRSLGLAREKIQRCSWREIYKQSGLSLGKTSMAADVEAMWTSFRMGDG